MRRRPSQCKHGNATRQQGSERLHTFAPELFTCGNKRGTVSHYRHLQRRSSFSPPAIERQKNAVSRYHCLGATGRGTRDLCPEDLSLELPTACGTKVQIEPHSAERGCVTSDFSDVNDQVPGIVDRPWQRPASRTFDRAVRDFASEYRSMTRAEKGLIGLSFQMAMAVRAKGRQDGHFPGALHDEKAVAAKLPIDAVGGEIGGRPGVHRRIRAGERGRLGGLGAAVATSERCRRHRQNYELPAIDAHDWPSSA